MPKATEEQDPTELWLRMSALPRPSSGPVEVTARGSSLGHVRFWVLSETEVAQARVDSIREARRVAPPGSLAHAEAYVRHVESAVVALAARDVDDLGRHGLPEASELRRELTDAELHLLVGDYAVFRAGVGPNITSLTQGEFDAFVDRLAKGADQTSLDALRWGNANDLADVPGVDASSGYLDCHFMCWMAARRVIHPRT